MASRLSFARLVLVFALVFALGAVGCESPNSGDSNKPAAPAGNALIDRGKVIYQTNCIACHNTDPAKPGAVGPEISGATREVVEARVLRAEYPQGYKPKRETRLMTPLPHLKGDLDAIHAYLNSAK